MNKILLLNHDSKMPLHRQAEERLRNLIKDSYREESELISKETDNSIAIKRTTQDEKNWN